MKPMDLLDIFGDLSEEDVAWMLQYQPPHKRTAFLVSKPFLTGISVAACLFVTVGLGFGIWSGQQKIESRPPQASSVAVQTEARTETTVLTTPASQMETTRIVSETVPQTTGSRIETEAKSETNSILSETVISSSESETIPAAVFVQTDPVQPSAGISSRQSITTTMPETEQTQAALYPDTEPVPTESLETQNTSAAVTTAEVPATSVAATMTLPTEPPVVDYDILPGFSVTGSADENRLQVTWLSEVPPSPAEVVVYHPESGRFVLEFAGRVGSNSAYWYDILDTETGLRVRIQMEPRRIFSRVLDAGGVLTLQPVGDNPGFLYQNGQQCALFWDNGCYQCSIYASDAEQALLLPVAEAMCPDDE